MKKVVIAFSLFLVSQLGFAQGWVTQVKKAIVSVVSYDKDGNILHNGNGFFIDNDGTALSDYSIFKDAISAQAIDAEGKIYEISYILGANNIYDVAKFKVKVDGKTPSVPLASVKANKDQTVSIVPNNTQRGAVPARSKISAITDLENGNKFYTIATKVEDKNVSCPVANEQGQVIALAQKGTDTESYGVDIALGKALEITALSANDYALNSIKIKKDIPNSSDEAIVFVMMSGNDSTYVERLIEKFPDLPDGYVKRATAEINHLALDEAGKDLATFYEKATDKADASYQISKLIYDLNVYGSTQEKADWNLEKALSEIDKALANSQMSAYKKLKGDILFAMGKYDQAYEQYNSLLGTDLKKQEVYSYLADCKSRLGAPEEEVIALLDSAVVQFTKPYPNEAAPYIYMRAQHKANAKKYREAVTDFNDVEHIYGGNASAEFYYNREQAEKNGRMYQQAAEDIQEALAKAPEDQDILTEAASLFIILKDYEKALQSSEKLISLYPQDPFGYRFKGYCQAMNGNKTEARTNLEKAKELGDSSADTIIDKYCK